MSIEEDALPAPSLVSKLRHSLQDLHTRVVSRLRPKASKNNFISNLYNVAYIFHICTRLIGICGWEVRQTTAVGEKVLHYAVVIFLTILTKFRQCLPIETCGAVEENTVE